MSSSAISSSSSSNSRQSHLSNEPPSIQSLVEEAKSLYQSSFANNDYDREHDDLFCTVAPGRVNLIGEHTDYTQGFVFPMAIEYSTVCVGKGSIVVHSCTGTGTGTGTGTDQSSKCHIISSNQKPNAETGQREAITFDSSMDMKPLSSSSKDSWTNYVAGVVQRYIEDVLNKENDNHTDQTYTISFQIAIAGNVPLGSGLSSSAALEVAIATFIERLLQSHHNGKEKEPFSVKDKALLCQKAENIFCNSPCGIMDQYVSAAGQAGTALLIDCRNLEYENVQLGGGDGDGDGDGGGSLSNADEKAQKVAEESSTISSQNEEEKKSCEDEQPNNKKVRQSKPVFVICNSNVTHSIGGGEYPKRVAQCKTATEMLVKLHGERISSLRDATLNDVEMMKNIEREGDDDDDDDDVGMDDLIYRRAKHVVTENERTQNAKIALMNGNWVQFGQLMYQSHASMKNDYEVSCDEIDILVDLAQSHPGVYGSRLTGGGFGGCTVTLVEKDQVQSLCKHMTKEYKSRTGKDCFCFETEPGNGAREIILS